MKLIDLHTRITLSSGDPVPSLAECQRLAVQSLGRDLSALGAALTAGAAPD